MATSTLIRSFAVLALFVSSAHGEELRPWTGYIKRHGLARTSGSANVSSRLIYLNRCIGGCTVHFDNVDDSRTFASSIADGTRVIPEFKQGDQVWSEVVQCVKDTFAPYNIMVTDQNPGTSVSYFMNIVGGHSTDLRADLTGAGGVAPFDCGEIPNAITYTFDVYGPDSLALCWTAAQEVAHAFGLDHEYLQKDPMTYLDGDLPKRFRDIDAPCGRFSQEQCICGPTTQNSYRAIVGLFGPTSTPIAPELTIRYPTSSKKTQPGFSVQAKATDDVRVDKVQVFIDGAPAGETTMAYGSAGDIFEIVTPKDIAEGSHELEVKAIDVQGVPQSMTMSFTQGPPCVYDDGCSGNDVCVEGVCIAGPETPGGLGTVCTADTECLSHHCLDAGESLKRCTADCTVGNNETCPEDFVCADAGSQGFCWPDPNAGCCDAGVRPQGPLLLGLGVGALLLRRRRRR